MCVDNKAMECNMLKAKLIELMEKITYESNLVEKMVKTTIEGLLESDSEKLDNAFEYENLINNLEMEIEEMCVSMISLYQPAAKNLRTIISVIKINSDFERMGDLCVNIIEAARFLVENPQMKKYLAVPNMAKETIKMLNDALQAFLKEDVALANDVCAFDDVIDAYYEQITRELITYMLSDPKYIERALGLLLIANNLERIADHCTNIAEYTIFISEGRVVKHNAEQH